MAGPQYSSEQLDAICTALYQAKDGDQLVRLFQQMGDSPHLRPEWATQPVMIGTYIFALFHSASFERLFDVIGRSRFEEKYFKELQDIWYNARYKEAR
uniref:SIX1_SD domain-containing protein n=1 Tax=Heterorhabditis bacteriophora TaxID=37862 RepID=A0A1I7XL33_HETBA